MRLYRKKFKAKQEGFIQKEFFTPENKCLYKKLHEKDVLQKGNVLQKDLFVQTGDLCIKESCLRSKKLLYKKVLVQKIIACTKQWLVQRN